MGRGLELQAPGRHSPQNNRALAARGAQRYCWDSGAAPGTRPYIRFVLPAGGWVNSASQHFFF